MSAQRLSFPSDEYFIDFLALALVHTKIFINEHLLFERMLLHFKQFLYCGKPT